MFGIRTPVKKPNGSEDKSEFEGQPGPSVRRSIGDWPPIVEKEQQRPKTPSPPKAVPQPLPPRPKTKALIAQEAKADPRRQAARVSDSPPITVPSRFPSKTAEAKACLMKSKAELEISKNLKREIKEEVFRSIERLYQLVKEAEGEKASQATNKWPTEACSMVTRTGNEGDISPGPEAPTELMKQLIGGLKQHHVALEECKRHTRALSEQLEKTPLYAAGHGSLDEHSQLLKENKEEIEKLSEEIKKQRTEWKENRSYASVVSGTKEKERGNAEMHSVVISSDDQNATGEDVFNKIRSTLNAKEEGIKIDRIRKVKDRKVIVGCESKEELVKIRETIKTKGKDLHLQEIRNKEPMVQLKDVLNYNKDEDIVRALINQNKHLLGDVSVDSSTLKVKFRRRARNPLTSHVAIQVPPKLWKRLTEAGLVHIDVQRVRVEDQSPLIQCSRCLGYGHGKRFCREKIDACSHCGEAHHRSECADWMARVPPSCCNCLKAKIGEAEHNAFSPECPVRKRWETLARSTVTYC